MKNYFFLACAIIFESLGTSFLKASEGFTKPLQTVIFVVAMTASFYMLTLAIRTIPIGIAYAIWSAVGIVVISIVGYFLYKQHLDFPAIMELGLLLLALLLLTFFRNQLHTRTL